MSYEGEYRLNIKSHRLVLLSEDYRTIVDVATGNDIDESEVISAVKKVLLTYA